MSPNFYDLKQEHVDSWQEFADRIHGDYASLSGWVRMDPHVEASVAGWPLVFRGLSGPHRPPYAESVLSVRFRYARAFHCRVVPTDQDKPARFPQSFAINGDDEPTVRALLDADIAALLEAHLGAARFGVQPRRHWWGRRTGEGDIYISEPDTVIDVDRLVGWRDLARAALVRLRDLGVVSDEIPSID